MTALAFSSRELHRLCESLSTCKWSGASLTLKAASCLREEQN